MVQDIFHSAALKLTAWYLAIIMVLSIGTSFALYRVSSADLANNVRRQVGFFDNYLAPGDFNNYTQMRKDQLEQDRDHLRGNLVLFNIVVLVAGGVVSYALARRTMRPIEESHESQKRFAGDASHELRTPLTAMQSEIEVALRNPNLTKKEAVGLLQSNLEEVAKLRDLSEGLLKLTNADADDDFDQLLSSNAVIDQAVDRVAKIASAKKVKINSSTKDLSFRGNQQYIVDLLVILLDNAIKYSPSGSQVSIDALRKDKRVVVSVRDHGQGIKTEDLPHIFERFYRAEASRSKKQTDGYGLGLAIAKKIADLHQAPINVKTVLGEGSIFTISLPSA